MKRQAIVIENNHHTQTVAAVGFSNGFFVLVEAYAHILKDKNENLNVWVSRVDNSQVEHVFRLGKNICVASASDFFGFN